MMATVDAFRSLCEGAPQFAKTRGYVLCSQGHRASDAWVIIEGTVSVWVQNKAVGKLVKVGLRAAGDIIGELSLFKGYRTATVIAETDITYVQISHTALLHWISNQPAVSLALLASSFEKIIEADTRHF